MLKDERLPVLDGLRGWGSIFVLLFHIFCEGLPVTTESDAFLRRLLPFSGLYAVMIFFTVSGISLSIGYLSKPDNGILIKGAAARYFRLAIPILAISLVVHFAMKLGLLGAADQRIAPFGSILDFETTIAHVVQFSLVDVFFKYTLHWTYAGPLWTMSVELFGSLLLFSVLFATTRTRHAFFSISLIAILILSFARTETVRLYSLFLFGAVIAAAIQRGWIERSPPALSIALLVVGLLSPAFIPPAYDGWNIAGTVALTLGCIASKPVNDILSCRFSQILGVLSFPLYLVHGPVLVFVGEPLMRNFDDSVPSKLAIDVGVIILSVIAALPMISVNKVAIRVSRSVGSSAASVFMHSVAAISQKLRRSEQPL